MKYRQSKVRRRTHRPRRAVILVTVLLMLALCGATIAQVTSRVVRLTSQATDMQRETQQRWAFVSVRRCLLSEAPRLLSEQSQAGELGLVVQFPIQQKSGSIVLSSIRYRWTLEDESAKAPIPRLVRNYPQIAIRPTLRTLLGRQAQLQPVIAKSPHDWKDVFEMPSDPSSSGRIDSLRQALRRVTLWSDGRVNLQTCDAPTLDEVWRTQFSELAPEVLHQFRDPFRKSNLSVVLADPNISQAKSQFIENWFTLQSTSYSLWIATSGTLRDDLTAVYVRRSQPGFAEEQFGIHYP